MRLRIAIALVAALVFSGQAMANQQLITLLKQLGKAVDDMSANISTAESDADAQLLAKVTRQTLDGGLTQFRPTIEIKAATGYCLVTIETPEWKLWSECKSGKVVDHGATIH